MIEYHLFFTIPCGCLVWWLSCLDWWLSCGCPSYLVVVLFCVCLAVVWGLPCLSCCCLILCLSFGCVVLSCLVVLLASGPDVGNARN
jgi:hypothetical protein